MVAREFADKWGEQGDLEAYVTDEERVVRFLQSGYRAGRPPCVDHAVEVLGADLTSLWITGSAGNLVVLVAGAGFVLFLPFKCASVCSRNEWPYLADLQSRRLVVQSGETERSSLE
jgi:hypothetical protein